MRHVGQIDFCHPNFDTLTNTFITVTASFKRLKNMVSHVFLI